MSKTTERIMLEVEKPKIRFSHRYWKLDILDNPKTAVLTQVKEVNLEDLPEEFKEMDTRFYPNGNRVKICGNMCYDHFPLPKKGKYLALGFDVGDGENKMGEVDEYGCLKENSKINDEINKWLGLLTKVFGRASLEVSFSTLRRSTPRKLEWYKSMIGKTFEIEVSK